MSIIQKHFTPAEVAQADSLIGQLEALLQPKLQNLDEDENQKYGVIDEKQKLFVDKDRDYRNTLKFPGLLHILRTFAFATKTLKHKLYEQRI